ncbi:MAG: sulfatase-like hydrolase/transferase [Chthoniobacterales bacterium]|nr:sulfatase-like hydrolase/transferase [Chthoniobacterales bacterium]
MAPNRASAAGTRRPNIIFILADDLGLDCVSCYGADQLKTPNIDALAKGGTRFEYSYATPLCGPSRAQILTGRYPFRTGMTSNSTGPALQPAKEVMLPKVLKPAGYVTAEVGKWAQLPLQPSDWGFDEYMRFPGSGGYWRNQKAEVNVNGRMEQLPPQTYLPDLMHDFLVDFIKRHKDQPFYVHYAMSHVHGPIVRTPDTVPGSHRLFADNIAYMDKLVGKLAAELDRLGLRENTVIVFVGDNGTAGRPARRLTVDGRHINGAKNTMAEGGSRVPLIVNWKGTTPAGRVCHDLTDFSDFFPTLASLAGARLPAGVTIDGHSFAPQIRGEAGDPREWVYVELDGRRYVATKQWKLNAAGELFDMKDAPFSEIPVPRDTKDGAAVNARRRLQEVMARLRGNNAARVKQTSWTG